MLLQAYLKQKVFCCFDKYLHFDEARRRRFIEQLRGTGRGNGSSHLCWQHVIREQSHGQLRHMSFFKGSLEVSPELFWF